MDRRTFLALCGASAALAGCSTSSGETDGGSGATSPGSGDGSGPTAPGSSPTPSESPADVTEAPDPLEGNWESYRRDAGNSGATDDPGPGERPAGAWRHVSATGTPMRGAAAGDGAFFVPTDADVLYAREATDGSIRWRRGVTAEAGPVVSGRTVAAAKGSTLVGLGVESGDTRWTVSLDGTVTGLGAGGGIVVATTDDAIVAVAPDDGATRWRHRVDGSIATPPGVGSVVATGLGSGDVVAVDAGTGQRRWRQSAGTEPSFAPAVRDAVYVPAGSRLIALDAGSGDRRWEYGTGHPVASPPAATADAVYFTTIDTDVEPDSRGTTDSGDGTSTPHAEDTMWFDGDAVALSASDGTEQWRREVTETYNFTSGPPGRLPVVLAGGFVVVGFNGTFRAYDPATGESAWSVRAAAVTPAVADGVLSTGTVGIDARDGSVRWTVSSGDGISRSPAVVGNTVYAGSDDTYLYALAANRGTVEWAARTDGMVRATPAVGDDAVYVGTMQGSLYGFDRSDGTQRWHVAVGGQVHSPTLLDGTVYVGTFSRSVFAFDATDGTREWRTTVDSESFVTLTVAAADGTVYAGENGDLRAFDAADGTQRWQVSFGRGERGVIQSAPVVAGGRVFVNAGKSVRALDAADGSELWSRPTGGSNQPPAVHDGTVYTSGNGRVYAFDAGDGTRRWRVPAGEDLGLTAADGTVYGTDFDTPLVALDAADGTERWRYPDVGPTTPPAVAGEFLFVGDAAGRLHALGPGGT